MNKEHVKQPIKHVTIILLGVLVYFGVPILFSLWLLSQLTNTLTNSPNLENPPALVHAVQLTELERTLNYIELFNIKSKLVFYDIYIENLDDTLASSTNEHIRNSIICKSDKNPFGEENISVEIPFGKKVLISRDLRLGENGEDNQFVNDVYHQCVVHSELSLNTFGTVVSSSTDIRYAPGSVVKMTLEPAIPIKIIIGFVISGLWFAFVNLITDGFPRLYRILKKIFAIKEPQK